MRNKGKTLEKIILVKQVLDILPNRFDYLTVEGKLREKNMNSILFYYFVYAGTIKKISRGLYEKTDKYNHINCFNILEIGKKTLLIKKDEKRSKISVNNVIKFENETELHKSDNIKNAIDLLKSNGYKILAPTTQYTEI